MTAVAQFLAMRRFGRVRVAEMEARYLAELGGTGWVYPSPSQPLLYPPLRMFSFLGGRYALRERRTGFVVRPWRVRA